MWMIRGVVAPLGSASKLGRQFRPPRRRAFESLFKSIAAIGNAGVSNHTTTFHADNLELSFHAELTGDITPAEWRAYVRSLFSDARLRGSVFLETDEGEAAQVWMETGAGPAGPNAFQHRTRRKPVPDVRVKENRSGNG